MSASNLSQLAPISPILSGAAIGAAQSAGGLVFPFLPIQAVAPNAYKGKVWVESSTSYMGSPQVVQTALGADYPRASMGTPTTVDYECVEYKLASEIIPQKLTQRSQFPTPLEERQAGGIGRKLAYDMERRVASLFFGTGNWVNAALAAVPGTGSQWDTLVTATPMQDLHKVKTITRDQAYGRAPDTLIMGRQVADAFANSFAASGIRVVTSGAAVASQQIATDAYLVDLVRRELGLRLLIGNQRAQTSAPGAAHASDYVWGKSLWMGCLDGADTASNGAGDIMARAVAALLIVEDGLTGQGLSMDGIALPISVRSYETAPPQAVGTIVAAEVYSDEIVLDANLGYLVTAVVS
jgi:hypothetical protein